MKSALPIKYLAPGDYFAMSPEGRAWQVVGPSGGDRSGVVVIESFGVMAEVAGMTYVYRVG